VVLALKVFQTDKNLSVRTVAKAYNISRKTLTRRYNNQLAQHDTILNSKKLTESEEETIVQYILELVTRVFPPRLSNIKDITNNLLYVRNILNIGRN
jgi:hypothetical protein